MTYASVFNAIGVVAATVMSFGFTPMFVAGLTLKFELTAAKSELFNRWYRLGSYFVAKCLADIVPLTIVVVTCMPLTYIVMSFPLDPLRMSLYIISVEMISQLVTVV